MDGQLIDKKAKAFWKKARNTVEHYKQYVKEKPDKFSLTFTDLLYASNFKAGNGNIQESPETISSKLKKYSELLRAIDRCFTIKTLVGLNQSDLQKLLGFVRDIITTCENYRIDGFGVPYCSALVHFYFPELVPVLDRRILMGMGFVTNAEQMTPNGQVKDIETYYVSLVEELHCQMNTKMFIDLDSADENYFQIATPDNLKLRSLRSPSKTTN